jgi:hypothetical protein
MGYMVELVVAPHLDIDGHIRKIKADPAGTFSPQRPAPYGVSPVSLQSVPTSQVPRADQPYAPAGYVHVARTTASGSHTRATPGSTSNRAAESGQSQQPAQGRGQYADIHSAQPVQRVV